MGISGAISSDFLFFLSSTNRVLAQIVPDRTLGAESSIVESDANINDIPSDRIEGGAIREKNLFHSFQEFSIREGRGAYFTNPSGVERIFSRVTGDRLSQILGRLGVLGNADLFLINPNGIIFGSNATLDLKGSFLATTADSLFFEDRTQFTTTDDSIAPVLTISIPISLEFRTTSGSILNQSQVLSLPTFGLGLQLQPGKTLALIGGNVTMQGGNITVPRGNIELGSVGGTGQVRLQPIDLGWTLNYEDIQSFQDIEFTQSPTSSNSPSLGLSLLSTIDINGDGGGTIQVRGRHVTIADGSQIVGTGVNLILSASKTVEVSGISLDGIPSAIGSVAPLTGQEGSVIINTQKLIVKDGGLITSDTDGFLTSEGLIVSTVPGGNTIVNASESVELDGNSESETGLFSRTAGFAAAGSITIETKKLVVRDGASISAESAGVNLLGQPIVTGAAGNISVIASESVELNNGFISTETRGLGGDAGSLIIETGKLNVSDGASILAATTGQGKGGSIFVNASNFINLSGVDDEGTTSSLSVEATQGSKAGNLRLETQQMSVSDGARVTVSSPQGQAGNLTIKAEIVSLNRGFITAETGLSRGEDGANINLDVSEFLRLENESLISATANETADGGNIDIDTDFVVAFLAEGGVGSDIVANAELGNGGTIEIDAKGVFGIEFRATLTPLNDITASSEFGLAGEVELNLSEIDPSRGITELPANVVDPSALIAQNPCKQGDESEFIVTGRGGLPPNINEDLSSEAVQVNLVEPVSAVETKGEGDTVTSETQPEEAANSQNAIAPAQGWIFNDRGEIVLTAYNPNVTQPERLPSDTSACPAL